MQGLENRHSVRTLLIGPLKVNNCPLFILLYYTKFSSLAIFYTDSGKTWLSVLFLRVIAFHLTCYSEIKVKKMIIWISMIGEYPSLIETDIVTQ